jgi:hypothetical protein
MIRLLRALPTLFLTLLLAALFFTCGCDNGDDDDSAGGSGQTDDDDNDSDDNDTSPADDDDDATPPNTFTCEGAGLTVRPFVDAPDVSELYAVAADLTIPTTNGDWNFKSNFTGCETYLFIQDQPGQARGWPIDLWDRDVGALLHYMPENTHAFFVVYETDPAVILEKLNALKAQADDYIATQPQEDQDRWFHRLHYVTQYAKDLPGWLGAQMTSPKWGVGIDRFQRIRYIGSYADPARYDAGAGWFAPNLRMADNEPDYYNYESDRDDELAAQNATVVPVFDAVEISGTVYQQVQLPTAQEMANFNTMEFDLFFDCVGVGEYGTCPAWDYIASFMLCDAGDPDNCPTEIGRWITTYHREGRWVHDVSALLPLLAEGGLTNFAFYTQNLYATTLSIRLYNDPSKPTPYWSSFLFTGGSFNPDYNAAHAPITLALPADATKVELAIVISGHGGDAETNCAEFCNTQHFFTVNGTDNLVEFPEVGSSTGCMEQIGDGTVPNQYGTWWYGRSGWCPGKQVNVTTIDVTSQATAGADNLFAYRGLYSGADYPYYAGAWIDLTSWVVVSK